MATIDAQNSVFFYVADNAYQNSMVALLGQSSDWLETMHSSSVNPDNVTANKDIDTSSGDFLNTCMEIVSMATIPSQSHPKFKDTYWVIRLDSNSPYGKVSFSANYIKNTLPVLANFAYSGRALDKSNVGFDSPSRRADCRLLMRFFCVRYQSYALMVGRNKGANVLAGFSSTGLSTLLRLATMFDSMKRGSTELRREAKMMAITKPCSKFIDTYWIVSKDSNTPSSKVSFTRNDCRIFTDLFKDSRLIWAGRKPVYADMGGN